MGKATAVLLASALCAGAASAQSSADISISNFRYALSDLDPNDGITPSLTFLAPQEFELSEALVVIASGSDVVTEFDDAPSPFSPVSLSTSTPYGSGTGTIAGSLSDRLDIHASGALTRTDVSSNLFNQISTGTLGFVLSPMTAVTFSSRVMLAIGLELPASLPTGSISASARVDVITDITGVGSRLIEDANLNTREAGSQSYDQPLTLTVTNALGSATTNDLLIRTSMNTQLSAVPGPVPEPGTWAMLLGGLALLAASARRSAAVPAIAAIRKCAPG